MEWIKVTGKTVEDAVTEAAITLGTSRENLEYNVIEKGSAGLFGLLGTKKAVIEARAKKSDEDIMKEVFGEAEESRKETKEARKERKKEIRDEKKESRKEPHKEKKEEAKSESGKTERPAAAEEKKEKKEPRREAAPAEEKAPKKTPVRKETEKKEQPEVSIEKPEEAARIEEEKKPRVPRVSADPEVAKSRASEFLGNVFRTMEMEVKIDMSFEEDVLSVNIDGEDMGVLIGKRGQTLDSLQYLTSLVVNKGNASYVRVKLDTEDYRNRRKATLENLAKNIAVKVKKTRRPIFLEPMNPYERRIIHSALQNDPYVTTHSEGEEPCRKVVVTLRKNSDRMERPDRNRPEREEGRKGRYPNRRRRRYDRPEEESRNTEEMTVYSEEEKVQEALIASAADSVEE